MYRVIDSTGAGVTFLVSGEDGGENWKWVLLTDHQLLMLMRNVPTDVGLWRNGGGGRDGESECLYNN